MQLAFSAMPPARPTALLRPLRRPWSPSPPPGPYKLPAAVLDRLGAALGDFRNADAAFALALFLGRYWTAPGRLNRAFPIDRRALADHAGLGLTEARIRGALRTLELVGFIDREPAPGSAYRCTAVGLQRRPIVFKFGPDFREAFRVANARAKAARGGHSRSRRPVAAPATSRPSPAILGAPVRPNSPKDITQAESVMIMGELQHGKSRWRTGPEPLPDPIAPMSPLDAALARLGKAVLNPGANVRTNQ